MSDSVKTSILISSKDLETIKNAVAYKRTSEPERWAGLTLSKLFRKAAIDLVDRWADDLPDDLVDSGFPVRPGGEGSRLHSGRAQCSPTEKPVEPAALSTRKAGQRLGVTAGTIRKMLRRGELEHIRVGGALRVLASSVEKYLAANRGSAWNPRRSRPASIRPKRTNRFI